MRIILRSFFAFLFIVFSASLFAAPPTKLTCFTLADAAVDYDGTIEPTHYSLEERKEIGNIVTFDFIKLQTSFFSELDDEIETYTEKLTKIDDHQFLSSFDEDDFKGYAFHHFNEDYTAGFLFESTGFVMVYTCSEGPLSKHIKKLF